MNKKLESFVSEFFGTLILILFGNGSVIVELIYNRDNPNILSINIAYGLGVTFGVYTAHKSGGHLNPAVTIQAVIFDKLKPVQIE